MAPRDLDPEGMLGYLLRRAQLKALDTFLEVSGGVHPRELAILQLLESYGTVSQQWLSDYLLINPSVMVKLIDQLEGAGQVDRRRNPEDRRSYALVITPVGCKRLNALGKAMRASNEELALPFTPQQFDHLCGYLHRLLVPHFDSPPPDVLERHCGWLLAHTYFRMSAIGDQKFAPLGLDTRTFVALAVLEQRAPCAQQELAGWLSIGGAATVELVDGLEKLGCVLRGRSDRDRRSYALQLTPAGLKLLDAARATVRVAATEFMSPLTASERAELIGLLALLTDEKELLPVH